MSKASYNDFVKIYNAADLAGSIAALGITPTAMRVIDPINRTVEVVNDGVCGFAWVNIKPGNSGFAKFLKNNGYARKDDYYGGVTVWVSGYNQSMQKKEAYAGAFARSLRDAGFDRVYSMSRMD